MKSLWVFSVCAIAAVISIEHDLKGFDDSILFGINWPGPRELLDAAAFHEGKEKQEKQHSDVMPILTADKEQYYCILPVLKASESKNTEEYTGPSPLTLLKPLFAQKICSYRLESYWSYEVCHGRYIRQYHEERDGKHLKSQEYYLGLWTPEKQAKLEAEANAAQERKELLKTTKVEGKSVPYVELVMDDGTTCDLSGRPRVTRVQYVCYPHGKHEVYSFKETSTCEYEIIILSNLLCEHPYFKPKEVTENVVDCFPIGDSPKKPRKLIEQQAETLRSHRKSLRVMRQDREAKDVLAVLRAAQVNEDGTTHLKFELYPIGDELNDAARDQPTTAVTPTLTVDEKVHNAVMMDDSPVRAFLNGENCLNGGSGWWKYEFCFGKHVNQYHVDRSGERTTVLLGVFDEEAHLNWIRENKAKAPKPTDQRTSISHFYSNGDICDKTGKPRQTEVKLKCLENSSSPAQVSLYLLEPRTCHYILGVESPLICDILPLADETGLIRQVKPVLERQENVVETEKEQKPKEQTRKEQKPKEPVEMPILGND